MASARLLIYISTSKINKLVMNIVLLDLATYMNLPTRKFNLNKYINNMNTHLSQCIT